SRAKNEQLLSDNRQLRKQLADIQPHGAEELQIELIAADPELQPRESMCELTVEEYRKAVENRDPLPPGVVYHDESQQKYWLADGFHRREARLRAGQKTMLVEIRQGTRRDALLYAAGANGVHGLGRTDADKRRQVLILLRDNEWQEWSSNEIARHCRVSPTSVGRWRREHDESERASLSTVDSEQVRPSDGDSGAPETMPKVRTYKTRHGTTAKMRIEKIGKKNQSDGGRPSEKREAERRREEEERPLLDRYFNEMISQLKQTAERLQEIDGTVWKQWLQGNRDLRNRLTAACRAIINIISGPDANGANQQRP
ncbi:MAG TPA: ParB N-terminal domain-containing protein, partial [Gemmataceae bacterium]